MYYLLVLECWLGIGNWELGWQMDPYHGAASILSVVSIGIKNMFSALLESGEGDAQGGSVLRAATCCHVIFINRLGAIRVSSSLRRPCSSSWTLCDGCTNTSGVASIRIVILLGSIRTPYVMPQLCRTRSRSFP